MRSRSGLARKRRRAGVLFVAPAVGLAVAFSVVPILMTAWMSLHEWSLLGDRTWVGLENYQTLLGDERFFGTITFTTKYTVLVTVVLLVAGLGLASLVRRDRPGVALLRTVAVVPVVIGFATASYIALWLLDPRIGPVNEALKDLGMIEESISFFAEPTRALLVMVAFITWKTVGLTMLLLLAGMHAIPGDVYEAAAVDGAGPWKQFRTMTLPLLKPTIALVTILTVVSSFLAFDQFFILTRGGPDQQTTTVVFQIYRAAFIDFDIGYGAALSIALLVLLLVLTAAQLRILRQEDAA